MQPGPTSQELQPSGVMEHQGVNEMLSHGEKPLAAQCVFFENDVIAQGLGVGLSTKRLWVQITLYLGIFNDSKEYTRA